MRSAKTILYAVFELLRWCLSLLQLHSALAAENLFLRKQLALYQDRKVKPRQADRWTKISMVLLAKLFNWKDALVIVTPETFIRWHRQGFRYYWRWKCRGRPAIPRAVINLIQSITKDNPNWSPERIANELSLKLSIELSPETVRKYMPKSPDGKSKKVFRANAGIPF